MKKETIFATVFGVLFGAVVGAIVLYSTSQTEQASQEQPVETSEPTVATQSAAVASKTQLVIAEPQTNTISKTDKISIKGSSPEKSLVIVQSPSTEVIQEFEEENFSVEFPLVIGENLIQVSVYAGSSVPQEESLVIYYIPD